MKSYFVSDVHLGLPVGDAAERERAFVAFLDSLLEGGQARSLYLLGDIFDFWYEYKDVIPRGFTRTLGALARLADSGTAVHFFGGNHDLWAYDYFESEIGITVHREPVFYTRMENEAGETVDVCLGHGDIPDCYGRPYRILYRLFHCRQLQRLFSAWHPRWAFALGHAWSKRSRTGKGKAYVCKGREEPLYKWAAARESRASLFIFGHLHCPLQLRLPRGGRLVLLADWVHEHSMRERVFSL